MKPQAKQSNGVKPGERAAHGCVPPRPIQRPVKRLSKIITYSYCIMARCSVLLENFCVKNGICKELRFEELLKHVKIHGSCNCSLCSEERSVQIDWVMPSQTFTFGLSRSHSRKLGGFSSAQLWQLCRLTIPHVWRVATSLNKILLVKLALSIGSVSSSHSAAAAALRG